MTNEEAIELKQRLNALIASKGGCKTSIKLYDRKLSGEAPIGRTTRLLAIAEGRDVMEEIRSKRNALVKRLTDTKIEIDRIRNQYPDLEARAHAGYVERAAKWPVYEKKPNPLREHFVAALRALPEDITSHPDLMYLALASVSYIKHLEERLEDET